MAQVAAANNSFSIEIGGESAGHTKKVEGGTPKAESKTMHGGPLDRGFHIQGNLSYNDLKSTILIGQSKALINHMNQTLKNQPEPITAIAHACDVGFKSKAQMEMTGLWISEINFNKLDANSGEAFYADFVHKIEVCKYKKGDDKVVQGMGIKQADQWRCNSFEVQLGSMPTDHVITCEIPKVSQKFKELRVGKRRDYTWIPSVVEIGDLKLQMPMTHGWSEWSTLAETYLVKGDMTLANEMDGSISFLSPKGDNLGELEIYGCTLTDVSADALDSSADSIRTFTVTCKVRNMLLKPEKTDM